MAVAVLALLVAACGESSSTEGSGDSAASGEQVIRFVPWGPKLIDFVDIYVADRNGYFKDENIKLEQLPAEGAGDAIRHVVAGNADIAMADPFSAYFAAQQGAPLTGFYCPYTKNWLTLVVNTSQGISRPEDLRGKTIGVTSMASTSRYYLKFLLARAGLKETDVKLAAVGRDFGSSLVGGRTAAASSWESVNWTMFEGGGIPQDQQGSYDVWPYEPYIAGPNDVYFAKSDWFEENKELAGRFVAAIAKAKEYIAENPEEATRIAEDYIVGQPNPEYDLAVIKMRIEMQEQGPGVEANGMGWCDVPTMQKVADEATELAIFPEAVAVEGMFTNEFVQER
jgi:NitT/TauT family transport system substrate-binding protein